MVQFFDKFPKTLYNIGRNIDNTSEYEVATNILARVNFLVGNIDSIFHYYTHQVKDHETPEILAEKIYGNPEAHWIILLSNRLVDPQYDWPMNYDTFSKYIIDKYTSDANAKSTTHHWEKIQKIVDSNTGTERTRKTEMTETDYDDSSLPTSEPVGTPYTIGSDVATVYEWKYVVDCYEWEFEQNELRRNVKIIKPTYYNYIQSEFERLMGLRTNFRTVT